jgi:riboflavin synthase
MFTGLIEEVGRVLEMQTTDRGTRLRIAAPNISETTRAGDSIAVNGCCLTAAHLRGGEITFDLLAESLERTNLKSLRRDSPINLERALPADGRLGGHFVQGHVDCAAPVVAVEEIGADLRLEIELPAKFAHYIAFKGSIAVNGISLTVAEILPKSFAVWIIPHTGAQTNLATIGRGDLVNLEFDLLAKYVERMLHRESARPK